MEYETIPRRLYLALIDDGIRIDHLRAALRKAKEENKLYAPDERKARNKVIRQMETVLENTDNRLRRKQAEIRKAENESY